MAFDPGPFDLAAMRLILGPNGDATTKVVTPKFYEEIDQEFRPFTGHVLISRHEFDEPWDGWEMHPKGDEFAYLLFGDVEFTLSEAGHERTVRINEEKSYVLIPKGAWHTARPLAPAGMVFVTPGEGTLISDTPKTP